MTKKQKVELLKAFHSGVPLVESLPLMDVLLIEADKGFFTSTEQDRTVPDHRLGEYLDLLNKENPLHRIRITIIRNDLFQKIHKQLAPSV